MRIQTTGIVSKVYKDPIDGWCVTVQSGRNQSTYIKILRKPEVEPDQKVQAGDTI